jgi:hypothetical protein
MQSESTRATSRYESHFRIDAPNARSRSVKVIALDRRSETLTRNLARSSWNDASFLTAFAVDPDRETDGNFAGWLNDIAGRAKDLGEEIRSTDFVLMIGTAIQDGKAISLIGEICSVNRVTTIALVVDEPGASREAVSRTIAMLRPWALMLVVASSEDYVADMLGALRV